MSPLRLGASSKYRAKPIVIDGIRFASQKEGARYQELKLLEKVGEVAEIQVQPAFTLLVNGVKVGRYVADFAYFTLPPGEKGTEKYPTARLVVEDVKGFKTPIYRLKKKMIAAQYGIQIREI